MKTDFKTPEPLIFERSRSGKEGIHVVESGVESPGISNLLPADLLRSKPIRELPEVSEVEVVRHFTRLSRLNHAVDLGFYPLGSCTMKYNPKVNEWAARLPGFALAHPHQPDIAVQGTLKLMENLESLLKEITGFAGMTLQPAAGAHGELTGVMMIRKAHEDRGNPRKTILIPDSAHGTNPASAVFAGYEVKELKSNERGTVDMDQLRQHLNEDVAALMLTVPNTLGVFEDEIMTIAALLHEKGAYLYCDGANFNAFMGIARPGDMGVDVMHLNLHKTFSTPHGGGGPGAGPVGVSTPLVDYLPVPRVVRTGEQQYRLSCDFPKSVGRVRSFFGNVGMLIRAYTYICALGKEGIKGVSERAVLNANYLRARLKDVFNLKYDSPTLHEVVFDDTSYASRNVKNMDIAKRLLDFGIHPPTVSFPLIVHGALMIEPTETEDREELDAFIAAMKQIAKEIEMDPEFVRQAPYTTPVRRLDEVAAARNPILRWCPDPEEKP
ncbi:MAG TPA: aminomethyl-transferring glycine dehydrogenase subunit GcvPB [Thermoanaerobaculia bacterium]|nr:aminomethyl-transferring glycine dehydrogenase subunit GcvPB [Thermoanaerobaculia bacterium]HUM30190.1 aminomethyl-transferring glycine dehydrogenase subunit GcvPB [Thermoanaerobaculia bacterium]HXK68361.1 aminomethyl-transferring glycine dehydrogenase subunit GcvPB [Thermoanaerobaculia bacterium]